jgi:hypothetical protein
MVVRMKPVADTRLSGLSVVLSANFVLLASGSACAQYITLTAAGASNLSSQTITPEPTSLPSLNS